MRRVITALLLAMGASAPALAALDISFSQPEAFTDAHLDRSYGTAPVERTMRGIERHLRNLSERWLPPEQTLRVEILDIDFAGRFDPLRALSPDVRTMLDITWPRIALRYSLQQDGRVLAAADEEVIDLDYLLRPRALMSRDPLRFEKAMLDDWFAARFGRVEADG